MGDDALRARLAQLLRGGLATEWQGRAGSSAEVRGLVAQLRQLSPDDYANKLRIAGFTLQPFNGDADSGVQACETCMYYVIHRRFCELPELRLPVDALWSCRLWRI
jgi:hypothetical protein